MDAVIKAEHLSKSYQGETAVSDFNLSVEAGMVYGLLGANGAGKSTTLECILGIKKPDCGEVSILGSNPRKNRKQLFEKVGVQFQEASYQSEIKVCELCEETKALYRETNDWHELLHRFGIAKKEKNLVKELSGGERQRLFIILALIPKPQVVFLDELTTGLDVKARREVWKQLEKLKNDGLTILLTSHFMDEVEALCDKITILKKGETVFCGTIQEAIDSSPCNNFEDAYLWYAEEEEDEEDI